MSMSPKIWVLVDNRIGNANQAIELAEKLGQSYEIKKIGYNLLGFLPSMILGLFPLHVKSSILSDLLQSEMPDIVISSGRRTAAVALYLKRCSKRPIKLIQIMRPVIGEENFDLIVLPQHDNFNNTVPNVVRIVGALTDVKNKIKNNMAAFESRYPEAKNFIAVVVGGNTKGYQLSLNDAKLLATTLVNIVEQNSINLFITFSRRTPQVVKDYFVHIFPSPNIIYDPSTDDVNPYPAMLGKATYIISTGDSITMCSEAVGTGKPVFIFSPPAFKLKKHNFFIQQLIDLGLAKRLDISQFRIEKYEYEPLYEIKRIAGVIKEKIINPVSKE